ncbi:MAG: DUF2213 domain-containing protein [Kiritimatiellales bacterium]
MSRFNDIVEVSRRRKVDNNGFVSVPAVITRVGIQQYRKDQLGIPGVTGTELVNVFRGADTVFHKDTIESFKHLPVTDGHPPEGVKPTNAKWVQGGHIGEDVAALNDSDLGSTLYLTDEGFITRSKGAQTSAGYDANIIKADGEHAGVKYEYKFDGAMIGNHLALVDRARCGNDCRVLDEGTKEGEDKMDAKEVKQIVEDAIAVHAAAQTGVITKTIQDALKAHQDSVDSKTAAAAQKIADDAAAETAKLQKTQQDEAAITGRVELLTKIKPLLGDKFDTKKSNKELLVLAFADSVTGAADKSEDYLLACLDAELDARAKGTVRIGDAATAPVGAVHVKAIV